MKYLFSVLIFILISCKGQKADYLEEITSGESSSIVTIGKKPKVDSLFTIITVPKTYLLKSNEKLKLIDISYYKLIYNKNNNIYIDREREINLNDEINFNIRYSKILSINDYKKIIRKNNFDKNVVYKIPEITILNNILNEFKEDEIRFLYSNEKNRKETISKSISVNLEF